MDSRVLKFQGLGFRDSRVQTFSVSGLQGFGVEGVAVFCCFVFYRRWFALAAVDYRSYQYSR